MENDRVRYLMGKIKDRTASDKEKDEYIDYLYNKGEITRKQFEDYKKNKNTDDILQIALIAGAGILLGILLGKLSE
ncbi:MAG: hypothetical protein LBV69_10400 [Bacteroidales bacterium]|jgi:hypothetical protein|nr:hypothetical protein [Bacteroidales bacterium]